MITTVTTITTATFTNFAEVSFALVSILMLILVLIGKEIMSVSHHEQARQLGKSLTIAAVPLLIIFAATFLFQVVKLFS